MSAQRGDGLRAGSSRLRTASFNRCGHGVGMVAPSPNGFSTNISICRLPPAASTDGLVTVGFRADDDAVELFNRPDAADIVHRLGTDFGSPLIRTSEFVILQRQLLSHRCTLATLTKPGV